MTNRTETIRAGQGRRDVGRTQEAKTHVKNSLTDKSVLLLALAQNFRAFFERVFLDIEPRVKLVDSEFIAVMVGHLEQVLHGSTRRLIVNLPPRHLKSLLISVAFVAFVLGQDPRKRIAVISHNQSLARDLAAKTKRVMESAWYREVFSKIRLVRDSVIELETSEGGCRYAASFDTGITGRGFDIIIVDDPIAAHDAMSQVERSKNIDVFNGMIASRLDHPEQGAIIVVAQRLHDDDLPGFLIRQGEWTHLSLPLVAEEEMTYRIGTRTWVRKAGEVLVPELYPEDIVAEIRKRLGESNFAAQYQQNPGAALGELIKDENILRFELAKLPPEARRFTLSIDAALKESGGSYTVALVMATVGLSHYVIDALRGRFEFVEMRDAVLRLLDRYRVTKVLIEDSAAGPSLASALRERGHQAELRPTRGRSKLERLQDHLHLFVDNRILVAGNQPWTTEFVNELLRFPNGRNDDQVDALTQYLAWATSGAGTFTPVVLGANASEAKLIRALTGPRPARGVHPMRNPKAIFARR